MANFNSTQYANVVADPRVANRTQDLAGRVRIMRADFTSIDAAQNDTLTLGELPKDAQIVLIGVKTTDLGTGVTLDLGHASDVANLTADDDVDAFIDGLDVAAAAVDTVVNPDLYVRLNTTKLIFATLLGANPDSGTLNFTVFYVVD